MVYLITGATGNIGSLVVERLISAATLAITGPEALSYAEMTAKISAEIGKPIQFQAISDEDARQQQIAWGAPEPLVEARLSICSRDSQRASCDRYRHGQTCSWAEADHVRSVGAGEHRSVCRSRVCGLICAWGREYQQGGRVV
jgi:hypothetical protein